MTIDTVPFEADNLLDWMDLTRTLEECHRLPPAEVSDGLLYRGGDTLLNRAAWIDGLGQLAKCSTIFPENRHQGLPSINGAVTLYADKTGVLEAVLDFHLVTKWKTAGDSLLAARMLARPDSRDFLLVGAGNVAASMVGAYRTAFPEARFRVWARNPGAAEAFARLNPGVEAVTDLEAAVREADVICTATMTKEPVLRGEWLQPGQHLDLIGAYTPDMREVDNEAMRRGRIFVDARATTIHHIGELMMPIASGAISEGDVVADFYDIATGNFDRREEGEITICKNGGGAHLDLMTATYILKTWRAR